MKIHLRKYLSNDEGEVFRDDFSTIDEARIEDIAEMFLDAYKDTIDYEGEDIYDAVNEIKNVLANKYGTFDIKYSRMILKSGMPISAIFVTRDGNRLFIPYVVTKKNESNRGNASKLLKNCIRSARNDGIEYIELYVTNGNVAAESLYMKLGFCKVDD